MYEIGKTEDNHYAKGLAFLIHPKIKDCVTDFKTYSNRVIRMEVNLHGKDSFTERNAYALTSSAEDEEVEQFYDDIERAMAESDFKYKIITGDFNPKIGTKTKEDFKSMGAFGIGERNERGDCLIEFAKEHKLIIANALLQIDIALSNQRGIVTNCDVITKEVITD